MFWVNFVPQRLPDNKLICKIEQGGKSVLELSGPIHVPQGAIRVEAGMQEWPDCRNCLRIVASRVSLQGGRTVASARIIGRLGTDGA
jgi:hypothetical protein